MTLEEIIPSKFIDARTGALFQPKKLGVGDRHVDSMYLTMNTAYQLNNKELYDLTKTFFTSDTYKLSQSSNFCRYYFNEESGRLNKDPRTLSRDNFIGMLICLGHFGDKDILKREAIKIAKRGSFYQNTRTYLDFKPKLPDFAGPVTWAILGKGLGFKTLLLDVFVLLMAIYAVIKSIIAPEHASTVYHEISTFHYLRDNSFLTHIAFKVYTKLRRGVKGYDSSSGVLSALKYYSRAKYDPPIYLVTEELLNNAEKGN